MAGKSLAFKWAGAINLHDKTKWQSSDGRSYKLVSPDLEKDRMFATAQIKSVKAIEENQRLQITGIANANIVDRMQERLDPRGIDLQDYLKNAQLLAHHSYYHPIGQVEAIEIQEDGIYFTAWIGDPTKAKLTPMQEEIRSLVAQGILKTVSVGFIPRKIRAPLYNDQGELEEPTVIEKWELLELSVVAVPCNQDSVFEMRNFGGPGKMDKEINPGQSLNDSKEGVTKDIKSLVPENEVVQTLIFDNARFNDLTAKEIAKEFGQTVELKFFDSLTEYCTDLELIDGVHAVTVKKKDGSDSKPGTENTTTTTTPEQKTESTDNKEDNVQQQMMSLMQQIGEGQKRVVELCELMLKKLEEKPSEDTTEEQPPKDDEEKSALNARIETLEKTLEKLTTVVNLLVDKSQK